MTDPKVIEEILSAAKSATPDLDCGDNSCYFAKQKGGMRTNGGCRCFQNAGFNRSAVASSVLMFPELLKLRKICDPTTIIAILEEHKRMREALELMLKFDPTTCSNTLGAAYAIRCYVRARIALTSGSGKGDAG